MVLSEHLPVLIVVLLFSGAFCMPPLYRWGRRLSAPAALCFLTLALGMALSLLPRLYREGPFTYYLGGWPPPWGIELQMDFLRVFMLLVILGAGLWIFLFSVRDLPHELESGKTGWYYTLYLLLIGSMAGMTQANDLFNLFVFMEIAGLTSCAIISIKDQRECHEASFKYLILSTMGSACYLLSVALIYMVTGHLNFDLVREALPAAFSLYPSNVLVAAALMIIAFGVKAALFPLHTWLPDAHATAPTPSSAILSGLVIKIYSFGVFLIFYYVWPVELLNQMPITEIVLWLATLGVIFGSISALAQEDIKMMLAYSSIAQIAYVFMGIGLNNRTALIGGLLHILNHAIMKAMLFMVAGIIIYASGLRRMKEYGGLGRAMPFTMVAFTLGAASMIGIPGTGGLIGKWYLALGALEAGRPIFVAVILLGSLLSAAYLLPVVINAFLTEQENLPQLKPLPGLLHVAVAIGMAGVLYFGFFPRAVIQLLERGLNFL